MCKKQVPTLQQIKKKIKANFIWTLIYPFEGILCKNKDDFPKLR